MADEQRLELLYQTLSMLHSIGIQSGPTDWRRDRDYREALALMSSAGEDIKLFRIPSTDYFTTGGGQALPNHDAFQRRFRNAYSFTQRLIEREERKRGQVQAIAAQPSEDDAGPRNNVVFVVHGRDKDAKDAVFSLLDAAQLTPRSFDEVRQRGQDPLPYVGKVLDDAFAEAQAVLVLFTPDERVGLVDRLRRQDETVREEYQPRPNVLLEAGMALARHPRRTVIVEFGRVRPISDLAGRHTARWEHDTPENRSDVLSRLRAAGCRPDQQDDRWMGAGRVSNPSWQ